ncbi:DIP1984 family protein [Candidatus Woesearchaeota archaeon]|nr:DIP1984 family protein [Candidatus Woesearchaeota archaeon]
MKLGEALSKLKKEKSRLARLILLRKENVYVEKGKKTRFDPKKLSKEIDTKIENIRKLKIRIQKTNLDTLAAGEGISLAEAIIKVNDLRSRLANLSSLFERKRSYLFGDKEEKEMIAQIDELEIEDEIEKLEIKKLQLDNKIQMANWTTQLID